MTDFTIYQSPFSWRYGSDGMRRLWSEHEKRRIWRRIWVALAEVQAEFGLVAPEQVADLRAHMDEIDIPRALEIEAEIHHDLMAEVRLFAEQAKFGGAILHLGATSMDIEDNADAMRLALALDLILVKLSALLRTLSLLLEKYADTPLIAYTHLQPAEPSTLGYRLAMYAQDVLEDYRLIRLQRRALRGKGFKGAVGTGASYAELLGVDRLEEFEAALSERLDISFYPIAAQTYPRKQDYMVIAALAGLGQSLYKFAFDLRLLQSPPIGELAEPFGEKQVGSSAMPFKRNPIRAEKIDSLARYLAGLPRLAWDNAAHSLLERTLDDSANRRILLPEAFLATDELLQTTASIVEGLRVDQAALERNLALYGPFAATERLLMVLVKKGADRQAMHERIRQHSMCAWEATRLGHPNPLPDALAKDEVLLRYLEAAEIRALLDYTVHVGDAAVRTRTMARIIQETLADV